MITDHVIFTDVALDVHQPNYGLKVHFSFFKMSIALKCLQFPHTLVYFQEKSNLTMFPKNTRRKLSEMVKKFS